jgi:hypothetical protein
MMLACTRLAVLSAVLALNCLGCCTAAVVASAASLQQQQQQHEKQGIAAATAVRGALARLRWQQQQQRQQPDQQQQSLQRRQLLQTPADSNQVVPGDDDADTPVNAADTGTSDADVTLASTVTPGPASSAEPLQATSPDAADPLDSALQSTEPEADLAEALTELIDSSTSVDPKPFGNRAPDPSDLPSHKGRKRCGTQAGSFEQQVAAEQRFQGRLQSLGVAGSGAEVQAEGGGSGDVGLRAAAGTVADIKVRTET